MALQGVVCLHRERCCAETCTLVDRISPKSERWRGGLCWFSNQALFSVTLLLLCIPIAVLLIVLWIAFDSFAGKRT